MKKAMRNMVALLLWAGATMSVFATDYTTYLTAERGFTEVTSTDGITGNASDYYILTSAENTGLIVGIGRYEAKPDWASTESKALRYKSAETDPILDLTNFFTIEKSGSYIGFRNVVYSADMFQTHDNAGYMYLNTYTDKNLDEWSYLIPSYQSGYWTFENGKYPMSSNDWACGYLGPWHDIVVADDALALNKRESAIGHYHLFRIAKADLLALQRKALSNASTSNPLNATWLITNPSFETGDETGWTLNGKDANGNDEFKTRDYGMSNKDGLYLMNAYQWWTSLNVSQTIEDVPSGLYELSAVVAAWEGHPVTFTGNSVTITNNGQGDGTGIFVTMDLNIDYTQKLIINAGSIADWWSEGHTDDRWKQCFFKLDNVQLTCKGLYLNGVAKPLPNDETTVLEAGQWYYYDCNYKTDYWVLGNLDGMVYSTDGLTLLSDITTTAATREMPALDKGRIYFKTTRSDATLKVVAKREIIESANSFSACALNVDGLPGSILLVTLNEEGPQSDGTKKISTYLNNKAYDIMAFSEDFNFDTELKSNISGYTWGTHRGKITGLSNNTDGLQFACKNSSVTWVNETYVAYNSTANTDGNQYVKKGYRHYDVTIDGQLIDVYITHMDAGDNSSAITSRGKQWKQLTEAINAVDNGRDAPRPKIVLGDTNCRWTRDAVKANFLDLLSTNFVASDVWVEFYRNGIYPTTDMADITDNSDPTNYTNYEIVDKIIYINPTAANTVQLVPQSFRIEQDYTYEDGTTPLGDHKPVVVEFKYVKSGDEVPLAIELANDADNTKAINDASGASVEVTLSGRTLYKDGSWNTICLPFDADLTGDLAEAELKELDVDNKWAMVNGEWSISDDGHKTGLDGSTLYLNFKTANSITAGKPYIVKWGNSAEGDLQSPTFSAVTINAGEAAAVKSEDQKVTFQGTYSPVILASDQTEFYLGADDKLYWPGTDDFQVNAFRAYFKLGEAASGVRQFVLNFGNEATGISVTLNDEGEMINDKVYDLQGRQLSNSKWSNSQIKKGLYISNGKKVVFK